MDNKSNEKDKDEISNNENKKADDKKWYRSMLEWIKRTTCITDWLIILCTLGIATIGFLQWKTLEKTDQTSRLRDRAFVHFLNPKIIDYPIDKPKVWAIAISVENAGNMPARSISIKQAIVETQKSKDIIDPFPLAKWQITQAPNVIGPKQRLTVQGGEIPISTIEKAQKSMINIFILMEVKYIDGFDLSKYRITQISRNLQFDEHGGYSMGFIGPHNCADDDCSKK